MENQTFPLKAGIRRSKEFERKHLATHTVNVGLKCGHACHYCSSPSVIRCHRAFKVLGKNPFDEGYTIVDPETHVRVARDVHKFRQDHTIMFCSMTDAWSPEAQDHGLGPKCLRVLLERGQGTVRVLTKNAAVRDSLDVMEQHRERVTLGLSLTAPLAGEDVIQILEPNASPLAERMDVLEDAHRRGLRTYGMLCPCLPGISDSRDALDNMFGTVLACGAEDIWLEPVNGRGRALPQCQQALSEAGFARESEAVEIARSRKGWNRYAVHLVKTAQDVADQHGVLDRLHILLYQKPLTDEAIDDLKKDERAIVWL